MTVGRRLLLGGICVVIALSAACSSDSTDTLWPGTNPTLVELHQYRYWIPMSGCGAPIIQANGQNWAPTVPWPSGPPPLKRWHVRTTGPKEQQTVLVEATIWREKNQLFVALAPDVIVQSYKPTTTKIAVCA